MRPPLPGCPGDLSMLAGARRPEPAFTIGPADGAADLAAHRRLRHAEFVDRQGLFDRTDADDTDDDPRTVVLLARAADGTVLGGVRLAPAHTPDIGWWTGSRLVTVPAARAAGVGPALVRAACAHAEAAGALRFDAVVQRRHAARFAALGWVGDTPVSLGGLAHTRMHYPVRRPARLAAATKGFLGETLAPLRAVPGGLGPAGFVGDDGVPVPGTDVVAACDAILPAMVERDPRWAGWCAVLVNINDLAAMGAAPVGLLDAVGAPTAALLTAIVAGVAEASAAWSVPVLGGHTQSGVPAALAVTALGRTAAPIPAGGGRVGDALTLTADLTGDWRPGYHGRQWDSSSGRNRADLARLTAAPALARPHAAKDVSMAGLVGTAGMLAEAGGTGAELDVAAVPRPAAATVGDWFGCFPGYGMLTADTPGRDPAPDLPTGTVSAACGRLTAEPGVRLHWPDGVRTDAIDGAVTGLGTA